MKQPYDYIAIQDKDQDVVHIFVEPQDLSGLDIGYVDLNEEQRSRLLAGDVGIGNESDGYYLIGFELIKTANGYGPLDFGDQEYDLKQGKCFLIKDGYEVVQLPCNSKEEAEKLLSGN